MIDLLDWLLDEYGPGIVLVLVLLLVGGALWALCYFAFRSDQDWQAFATAHHCRVIRETAGQTIITSDGKTAYLSATKTWACDDGKEYTR